MKRTLRRDGTIESERGKNRTFMIGKTRIWKHATIQIRVNHRPEGGMSFIAIGNGGPGLSNTHKNRGTSGRETNPTTDASGKEEGQ